MITRDDALRYFDSKKQTFGGMQAGDYIDKDDFEKLAELLPSQPLPTVQGEIDDIDIVLEITDTIYNHCEAHSDFTINGVEKAAKVIYEGFVKPLQPSPNPTVLIDALNKIREQIIAIGEKDTNSFNQEVHYSHAGSIHTAIGVIDMYSKSLQSYLFPTTENQDELFNEIGRIAHGEGSIKFTFYEHVMNKLKQKYIIHKR